MGSGNALVCNAKMNLLCICKDLVDQHQKEQHFTLVATACTTQSMPLIWRLGTSFIALIDQTNLVPVMVTNMPQKSNHRNQNFKLASMDQVDMAINMNCE